MSYSVSSKAASEAEDIGVCAASDIQEHVHKHGALLEKARGEMPSVESLYDLSELFKVFGDTTRIRILWALSEGEMCVCDLADLLEMGQSAISHQLRLLRQARLVRCRREGKSSVYMLDDDHVRHIFELGLSHIEELK